MVDVVVILENFRANLKKRWHNFSRLVQLCFSYDYDRYLDLIMIGGGLLQVPGTEPWKRYCFTLYRLLGFYQFVLSLARAGFSSQNQDDLVALIGTVTIAVGMTTACFKICIQKHYEEAIRESKAFLCKDMRSSNDPNHDASIEQDNTMTARKVVLIFFIILCFDQVMLWIPNSSRDRILGTSKQFQCFGSIIASLMQGAYVSTCFIFWACRYYCTTLTIIPILRGLRSKLIIVARGFETVEDRVQALIFDDQNMVAGTSRKLPSGNALSWNHLKRTLGATVEQQVEVLRNIQLMQPVVSWIYTVIYYGTMIAVSMLVLLSIRSEVSLISIVLVLTGCIGVLECYFWCQLTDSFKENIDKTADVVAQLGCRLEHSVDHHSDYVQMRRSLMIIQVNASQANWFNCGVFFPISVESFGDLCMIIYRFATFLMDLG